ncbi:hypothetical protein [Janthinobacterium sp. UMAB-60]|nr:hypothetical protein [Janthinobacterium sp. UMAB-60]
MTWIKIMVKRGKVEALRNEGNGEQITIRNKAVLMMRRVTECRRAF